MTVRNPDLGLIIREEMTVRNPIGKTQLTLGWMKSTETNKFPVSVAKVGRGVAELLVNPVSQGLRTKPNQKEFLKKIGERNEDFRNDEGFDKAVGLKKTDDFKLDKFKNQKEFLKKIGEVDNFKKNCDGKSNEDFRNDDGFYKADGFKKTDDFKLDKFKKNKIKE